MRIVGRPELIDEPWFADHTGRLEHVDELDEIIQGWIGERTTEEVLARVRGGRGARSRRSTRSRTSSRTRSTSRGRRSRGSPHPKLGSLQMQNVIPRLSETPGRIRSPRARSSASTTRRSTAASSGSRRRSSQELEESGVDLAEEEHVEARPDREPVGSRHGGVLRRPRVRHAHRASARGLPLLVIDMARAFCDPSYKVGVRPDADDRGDRAPARRVARRQGVPVYFTTVAYRAGRQGRRRCSWRRSRRSASSGSTTRRPRDRPADRARRRRGGRPRRSTRPRSSRRHLASMLIVARHRHADPHRLLDLGLHPRDRDRRRLARLPGHRAGGGGRRPRRRARTRRTCSTSTRSTATSLPLAEVVEHLDRRRRRRGARRRVGAARR